jgi:hypothetical protein
MQKKFKHKKTGEIATYKDGILKSSGFCVEIGVEPSSEFWEEVVEKDYEILTVITNDGKFIEIVYNQSATIEPFWKIHSVKRKSDGEIFTIGDVCCPNGYIDNDHPITKFELILNNTRLRVNSKNWYLGINDIIKSKPILFTTEDGVDIYEGDKYYIVGNKTFDLSNELISYGNMINNCKKFSTKEKAEEYILWNKPCLSLNDVASIYPGVNKNHSNIPSHQAERLKELVKSKL